MLGVEVVRTEPEFLALEREWQELVCQCPDVSYFLTWEFIHPRWKYFAAERDLWVLIARDPHGALVGIAPFAIARTSVGPLSVNRLEYICRVEIPFRYERFYLDGENLDIIARPDCRDSVAASFVQHLERSRKQWDIVDLGWLSPGSSLRAHIKRTRSLVQERTSTCAVTSLPDDWSTYERTVLGKSESKQIRKDGRRLEREFPGQVKFSCIVERDDVAPALENLDQMKNRRWDDLGQLTPADGDAHARLHQQFERDFMERAFDRGWLRYYQLWVGDHVIAGDCNVILHGTHYSIKTGFDPAWKAYSPGNVIQAYEVAQMIEEGVREHDYAHGAIDTKRKWTNAEREDVRLIASTSWKGFLYVAREAIGSTGEAYARRLARRLLPVQTRRRVSRAVRNRTRRMQESSSSADSEPTKQSD